MQLGFAALRKAERHSSSFHRYIEDLLIFVPDLREEIYACAVEETKLWRAVTASCEDV